MRTLEEIISAINSHENNAINIEFGEEGISYSYDHTSKATDHPELSIITNKGCHLNHDKTLAIKQLIEKNDLRTWLRVRSNDEEVVRVILEQIKDNSTIQKLSMVNLSKEQITNLFTAFENNSTLSELYLRRCTIGRDEAMAVAKALETHPNLKELDLEFNKFTSEGIMILAKCLKSNNTLTTLDLSHTNAFTDEVERAFIEVLICNASLTKLGMSYSNINEMSKHLIQDLLKINKHPTRIKDKLLRKLEKAKLYNYEIIDKQSLLNDANLQKDYTLEDHNSLVISKPGLMGGNAGSPDG
jgi:hypothetical protein